jgi:hypothetical protein
MLFFESSSRSIFLFEHDPFRKPVPTFPDHALAATDTKISATSSPRPAANPANDTPSVFFDWQVFGFCGMLTNPFYTKQSPG